ncbi:DAF-7 protein [Aphelenchoides bicaudatus]|nr:DAF-7 protein [Aphelenchoides bicaudatus]
MPSRSRRNANSPQICQVGHNNTKCCLYDLMIDFEKVGWDFVIAPKRYNAYICLGNCLTSKNSNSMMSSHSSITSRLMTDPYQCCHPKDYSGVTVVYVTESNEIWVKDIPSLVAKRCGCS